MEIEYLSKIWDYVAGSFREFVTDVKKHGLIRGYEGLSVQEIAEMMKPDKQSREDKPIEFANTLGKMLREARI